ncbi:helix-turn-helix transcriptional regulator [Kineococcus sp. SYSU DK018]|uniref:helix-turn-helix transcriptional regulator n=1 Tax=Kineococcus sp. SYSU DK018 TaxID=3383139 RepID=UPI003D7E0092
MLLTLRQAVEATGVSLSTMRRRLRAGEFPNAQVDPQTGAHLIAVPDLLAAGFTLTKAPGPREHRDHPGQPRGDQGSDHPVTIPVTTPRGTPQRAPEVVIDVTDDEVQRLRDEVAELRERATRAEVEAARAQAVADERAAALADVRLALRAITAASEQREQQPPAVVVHEVPSTVPMTRTPSTTPAAAPDEPSSEQPRRRGLFGRWRQR